ncbi:MFS transporter [Candidatus Curtissbacteria bacterium]|nr:MFS transporter [Candidatus Curtissbacteria bacterium]
MSLIPSKYLTLLKNRNFFNLTLINLFCQFSFAVLSLVLVSSSFDLTRNNFGVSAVILSFAVPAIVTVIFAGLAADIFDRKRIITYSVALMVLVTIGVVNALSSIFWMVVFSAIYHLLIPIFLPAISASYVQVIRKNQLLVANSIFTLTVIGGQGGGLMLGSIMQYYWGFKLPLLVSAASLIITLFITRLLPRLLPRKSSNLMMVPGAVKEIIIAILFVLHRKRIWFYLLFLGFIYGIFVFGATIGPGFFDEILGLPVRVSPVFVLPSVTLGLLTGMYFLYQNPSINEGTLIVLGSLAASLATLAVGLIMGSGIFEEFWLVLAVIFAMVVSFGAVIVSIAARTGLQKLVPHKYQGTVFAMMIIFSAIAATIASPSAAFLTVILGYINILILVGFLLLLVSLSIALLSFKWRF